MVDFLVDIWKPQPIFLLLLDSIPQSPIHDQGRKVNFFVLFNIAKVWIAITTMQY